MFEVLIASVLFALLVGVVFYYFTVKRSSKIVRIGSDDDKRISAKIASSVTNSFIATLPVSTVMALESKKIAENSKIPDLLRKSKNPWNIKPADFRIITLSMTVFGLAISSLITLVVYLATSLWYAVFIIPIFTFLCYNYPTSYHKAVCVDRDLDFKRNLSELLDLMIVSLSSGLTFAPALKETLPHIREGATKEAFQEVLHKVESGQTLEVALEGLMEHAPNDSVYTFAKGIQTALRLDTPILASLSSQAESTRKDFSSYVEAQIANLDSAIGTKLTPAILVAISLAILPSPIYQIMNSF